MKYLFLFCLIPFFAKGQSQLSLCNNAYLNLNNSNFNFEISIGESVITTLTSANALINQGFLQPSNYYLSSIAQFEQPNIKIYPNPFSDDIIIENIQEYNNCKIYDALGTLVFTDSNVSTLSLEFLSAGVYFLSITDANHAPLNTFKLTKL